MKRLTQKEKQEAHARLESALQRIKPRDNLIFAIFFVLLAYLIGSRALDTGSLMEYSLAGIAMGLSISNLIGFTKKTLGKDHAK